MNPVAPAPHLSRRGPGPSGPRRRAGAVLGAALLLAGCGGGSVSIGIGCCYGDDPPWATLSADRRAAYPGDLVRVDARVGDDGRVDQVRLYQVDYRGTYEIDRVSRSPLSWEIRVPNDPGGQVGWYVVAIDNAGQDGSSRMVVVDILR